MQFDLVIGVDTFTYAATDSNNNPSNTATAHVTLTPTLHLSPSTLSGKPGDQVTVQVILDNADQGTLGDRCRPSLPCSIG